MIQQLLEQVFNQPIKSINSVSGGDINNAYRVEIDDKLNYFVKHNTYTNGGEMLRTESIGLQFLSAHSAFNIPKVIACTSIDNDHFLVLDFISSGQASNEDYFLFGKRLADMHKTSHDHFGFDNNNFIGKLHQKNDWSQSWKDFYMNNRIGYQLNLAIDNGLFASSILAHLDTLEEHWNNYIPEEPASLLHGDLWSGNYVVAHTGDVTIIDPAVYFGHREIDIAMTRVFGGFPKAFYEGYESSYPLEEGYEKRQALYQLYPMLVHANIFGGSYSTQTMQMIKAISREWE